jgi:hypothetical protein
MLEHGWFTGKNKIVVIKKSRCISSKKKNNYVSRTLEGRRTFGIGKAPAPDPLLPQIRIYDTIHHTKKKKTLRVRDSCWKRPTFARTNVNTPEIHSPATNTATPCLSK